MVQAGSNALGAKWGLLGLCLLAIALNAARQLAQESLPSHANVEQPSESLPSTTDHSSDAEPSIFDFQNYVRLFRKVYRGRLEEMARLYYFSARAIRVFVAAIKYRHGEQPYYLGINWLSDATPEELDKMRNKVLESQAGATPHQKKEKPVDDVQSTDPGADIEADLRQLAKENQNEPGLKKLGELLDKTGEQRQRKKRDVSKRKLRHLPRERLINTGSTFKLDPEVRAKMTKRVPSNNPNYKPIELFSEGLADEQVPVLYNYRSKPVLGKVLVSGILYQLDDLFADDGTFRKDWNGAANDGQSDDEVFFDLRKTTNCFLPPRNQGLCGACFAFATITIAEWLYCMQTGDLVAFSEQYLIDCGRAYVAGLYGCNGGDTKASARFLHNFGLELLSYYPYLQRDNWCPYYKEESLINTGFIRTDMPALFEVKLKEIPHLLQFGPMFITIKGDPSFGQYSGGVHGIPCFDRGNHGVVLVGHGRENGREYWLIRNSFGVGWGEDGYYKLDKSVDGICERKAWAFATRHGFGGNMNAFFNPNNPADRLRERKMGMGLNSALFPTVDAGNLNMFPVAPPINGYHTN